MRKLAILILAVLVAWPIGVNAAARPDSKKGIYFCQGISGGASGDLDELDITAASTPNAYDLVDGDGAIVMVISGTTVLTYHYTYDADGTTAESSPTVIRPDDYSDSGVWRLDLLQANTDSDGDGSITDESWYTALVTIESINTPSELGSVATISANMTSTLGAADYAAAVALWETALESALADMDITNVAQVQDISATASEINTPLDGASVTLTEFRELETIGDTTISAAQWGYLGAFDQALTQASSPTFAGITVGSITSSAADGGHYTDIVNGVAISATASAGRLAYYNGVFWISDADDWTTDFLIDNGAYTGNTETGIAVTPQSDGTVDFVVAADVGWAIGDTAFTDLTAGDSYTNFGDAADDTIDELLDAIDTAIGALGSPPTEDNVEAYIFDTDTETITGVWTVGTDVKLQFRDSGIYINSGADGYMDFGADGAFRFFDAVNNGDPVLILGASAAESLSITANLGAADQLLDEIEFSTATAQGDADAGRYIFDVDGADILTIDDGGISVTGVVDATSFKATGADADPSSAGHIVYDNSITGMSGGGLRWYDDDSVRIIVDLEADPSDDDYVVAYDADADGFYMKEDDGGGTEQKSFILETPADADNILWFRPEGAITVTGIDCIVNAATSAVITVQECDANGGSCSAIESAMTCAATNTAHASTIDNASVDAGDWIRVDVGTVTGTVGHVAVTMNYTKNTSW